MRAKLKIPLFFFLIAIATLPYTAALNGVADLEFISENYLSVYANGGESPSFDAEELTLPYPATITESWYAYNYVASNVSCTPYRIEFNAAFDKSDTSTCPDLVEGDIVLPNDMVFFMADDTVGWAGHEFGVLAQMNGSIYGYVANGDIPFDKQLMVEDDDSTEHNYVITLAFRNGQSNFQFYIDGTSTLNMSCTSDFTAYQYKTVFTTHRYTNEWDSHESELNVNGLVIYGQRTSPNYTGLIGAATTTTVIAMVVIAKRM